MLSLKLGLSLNTVTPRGGWSPSDEANLEAWYQNKVGITLNGSDVSTWADSSTNSFDMTQGAASQQPAYDASTGKLTFDKTASQNLGSSQISLTGAFTIGVRLNRSAVNITVLGDNDDGGHFFQIKTSSQWRIKIGGSQADFTLDSGTFGDDYLVITRNASNLITLYKNGTAQADTETLSGTALIDAIGVRATDNNPYGGTIREVQIYDTENATLTAYVNDYLSNL